MNGSRQCTYAKSNGYTAFGDTGSPGTGERIFCLYQELLAIKWVQWWSSSLHLLRDKEINNKDIVKTMLMKNSLIWTTLDFFFFFMGSSLGLKDKKYTNFHTFTAPFCFCKRFDRLYYINDLWNCEIFSAMIARDRQECTWQNCNPRWMWHREQKYAFVYFVRTLSPIDNSQ